MRPPEPPVPNPVERPPQSAAPALYGLSHLGKFWTPSNVISLLRLLLAIPLFYLILVRELGDPAALLLILIAVVTDWFDGKIARWSKTVSEWGKVIDPVADKIVAASVILALTIRGDTVFQWWFLALLLVRDALVVAGGVRLSRRRGRVFMSLWSGKLMVTAIALTGLAVLLRADPPIPRVLLWISTGLIVYSFFRYVVRYVRFMRYGVADEPVEPSQNPAPAPAPVDQT